MNFLLFRDLTCESPMLEEEPPLTTEEMFRCAVAAGRRVHEELPASCCCSRRPVEKSAGLLICIFLNNVLGYYPAEEFLPLDQFKRPRKNQEKNMNRSAMGAGTCVTLPGDYAVTASDRLPPAVTAQCTKQRALMLAVSAGGSSVDGNASNEESSDP